MSWLWKPFSELQEALQEDVAPGKISISRTASKSTLRPKQINDHVYEVHKPAGMPSVELVFFHGLQLEPGSSKEAHMTTWVSRDKSEFWLTWLLGDIPEARVLTISYNAAARTTELEGRGDMYVSGENLVYLLTGNAARVGQNGCPVVLVGHCLGGLVMKEVCCRAFHMIRPSKPVENFLENLKGLFFYGTPHDGSFLADYNKRSLTGPLIKALESLEEHTAGQNLDFRTLRNFKGWKTFGVGELLPVKLKLFDGIMVPEASARSDMDSYYGATADHYNICRPEDKQSSTYQILLDFIHGIVNEVPPEKTQEEDLRESTTKEKAYYMVPDLRVSNYVERIDLLESVKSAVQQRREQQLLQVVVLLGMGGQGKSQLAMEYCRTAMLSKEFRDIFWIDASSIKSAHRSFERIVLKIADPFRIFGSIEEKITFVKDIVDSWDSRWLLVFDNYDAPNTNFNVATFFPSSPFGTILVTSRHEDAKRLGKVIPVSKMTEQESLKLLFRRSEIEWTDENMETGKSIVAKLGFLPLAIDQAGAFISAQKLPLTLFLKHFDLQKEEILKYTPSLTEYRRILDDDGNDMVSDSKVRAEEPGCDLLNATEQLSELVREFIAEIQKGDEGGFIVSVEWLYDLEEHEKEVLMSVLSGTGYSEVYHTTTTILYQRLDQDNAETSNVTVCSDPSSAGFVKKPLEEEIRSSILDTDREANTHSNLSTLKGKEELTVEQVSTSMRSFIAALNEKGCRSYWVSTEWLSNLQSYEKEMLESVCMETGFTKTYQNDSTTYYERVKDHVRTCNDGSGSDAKKDSSRPLDSPSTSGAYKEGGELDPKELQSLSINDGLNSPALISVATEPRPKSPHSECISQLFRVSYTPLRRSRTGASTSSSQDGWGTTAVDSQHSEGEFRHSVRELCGDNYVILPKLYRSKQDYITISTTVEKLIEMESFDYRGKTGFIPVPVNLKAVVGTTFSCCLKNNPNRKTVRVKVSKIRGEVQYWDNTKPNVIDLVLQSVYINVDAFIKSDDESIELRLCPPSRIVGRTYNESGGIVDQVWVKLSEIDLGDSESGSITVELKCDERKRRCIPRDLGLRFQDSTDPVMLEGDIRRPLDRESALELDIRFGLRLSFSRPWQPSGLPFCRTRIAYQDIDFDCRLELISTVGLNIRSRMLSWYNFFMGV